MTQFAVGTGLVGLQSAASAPSAGTEALLYLLVGKHAHLLCCNSLTAHCVHRAFQHTPHLLPRWSTHLVCLIVQAAGYATNFTPAKLVQAGGGGGAAWTGGMQDALLTGAGNC